MGYSKPWKTWSASYIRHPKDWYRNSPITSENCKMHEISFLVLLILLSLTQPASAQFRCKKADGSTTFQDIACPPESSGERLRFISPNSIGPAADRPDHIRAAIAAGRPAIGMTLVELHRTIGLPEAVNAAQFKDQLIYRNNTRTLYVYTTNGIVTAMQNSEGGRSPVGSTAGRYVSPSKTCPSSQQIRSIEVDISKMEYRDKPEVLVELHRQLGEARSCQSN